MVKCENVLCINNDPSDDHGCKDKFKPDVKLCEKRIQFKAVVNRMIKFFTGWKSVSRKTIKKEVYDYIIDGTKDIDLDDQ